MLETTPTTTPSRADRIAAVIAVLGFIFGDVIAQLLVLWWACRSGSTYAKRWALVSLALELVWKPIQIGAGVIATFMEPTIGLAIILVILLVYVALMPLVVVLAIRAARGHDAAECFVPDILATRLPS